MTTPAQRLTRLLGEGARFKVELPGHAAIDLTSDVIAALAGVQNGPGGFKDGKESIEPKVAGREVRTGVHFP